MHPARRSYLSAFQAWHDRIKAGLARPLEPRAFAAPRRLRGETGARAYDVVLAGDWTRPGGAGIAGIGQLRALTARGQRAALLHLDIAGQPARRPAQPRPGRPGPDQLG